MILKGYDPCGSTTGLDSLTVVQDIFKESAKTALSEVKTKTSLPMTKLQAVINSW